MSNQQQQPPQTPPTLGDLYINFQKSQTAQSTIIEMLLKTCENLEAEKNKLLAENLALKADAVKAKK